jgi:Zn-dependent alcohol dehydrogenase
LAKSLSLTTTNLLHINVDLWLRGLGWWKLQHLQCGDFIVKEPMVVGHECAGIVEESGKDVEHLVVGDCVALEPGISCHHCDECKEGSYNLCSNMRFFATPPGNWLLAQQVHNSNFDLLFVSKDGTGIIGQSTFHRHSSNSPA